MPNKKRLVRERGEISPDVLQHSLSNTRAGPPALTDRLG